MKKTRVIVSIFLVLFVSLATLGATGAKEAPKGEVLDILWRIGGQGEYMNPAIEKFKEMYPNVEVKLEYNPKAEDVLRPRLISGNPPDIFQVNVGTFDFFGAIEEGKLRVLDDVMKMTPVGESITIGDKLQSNVMDALKSDGHYYIVSDNLNLSGLLYDKALFAKYGWKVPETWDQFVALCEQIKKDAPNIAPVVFPGMYPYYLTNAFFLSNVASFGGQQAIKDLNNLTPGFFTSAPFVKAAERIQYMRDHGYFHKGLIALSHTESQMEFINHRAAMLAAGSWVFNEMAGNWPPGFELESMLHPTKIKAGDPGYMRASNSYVAISADAKNPEMAIELLRILYSEPIRKQVAKDYTMIIPVESISEGLDLPKEVLSAFALLDEPLNELFITPYEVWYNPFNTTFQDLISSLVMGNIDAKKFSESMEAAAEQVRKDSSIKKYKLY